VTDADIDSLEVTDNPELSRLELHVEGRVAFVDYRLGDGAIAYVHTDVPEALRGRGIAARLARHALGLAPERGLQLVPPCPYVSAYLRQHPEYADLVAPRRLWRSLLADT